MRIEGKLKNYDFAWLYAINGGVHVGSAKIRYYGNDAEIDNFYICDEWQGQGLGREFYRLVERRLRRNNVKSVELLPSSKGEGFWRRQGFRKKRGITCVLKKSLA